MYNIDAEMEREGLTPVFAFGFTFKLNKPLKHTIYGLLTRLDVSRIIRINGVDDIITGGECAYGLSNKRRVEILKQVIDYAKYLDDRAYFERKAI
jgi:hypothetical protein